MHVHCMRMRSVARTHTHTQYIVRLNEWSKREKFTDIHRRSLTQYWIYGLSIYFLRWFLEFYVYPFEWFFFIIWWLNVAISKRLQFYYRAENWPHFALVRVQKLLRQLNIVALNIETKTHTHNTLHITYTQYIYHMYKYSQ